MSYTCEPSTPTARRGSGGKHTVHKQVRMRNASVQCAHCANMIGATVIGSDPELRLLLFTQVHSTKSNSSRAHAHSRCLNPIHRGQPPSSAAAYCDPQTARHTGRTHDRVWWSLCESNIESVETRFLRSTSEGEGEAANTCVQSRVLPLPTRSICLSLSHAQAHCKCDRRPMRALHSHCMAVPWQTQVLPRLVCMSALPSHSNIEGPYAPK
jgi:hypothetical protein